MPEIRISGILIFEMGITVLFLVLISAVMHAVWNFILKKSPDKEIFTWWFRLVSLLLYTPVFIYLIIRTPSIPKVGWYCLIGSGFCHAMYWRYLGKAYTSGDLSHAYPLVRSAPVFVVIWAVLFLGESISLKGTIGIILVCIGGYILYLKNTSLKGLTKSTNFVKDKSWILALMTALFISFYSVIDKLGVKHVSPYIYIYLENLFSMGFLSACIFSTKKLSVIKDGWHSNKGMIFIAGGLCLISYLLILITFVSNKVSYIVTVRQSSIIFGVILGCVFLKEGHGWIRLAASVVIFLGIGLVVLA